LCSCLSRTGSTVFKNGNDNVDENADYEDNNYVNVNNNSFTVFYYIYFLLTDKLFLRRSKHIISSADETKLVPLSICPPQVYIAGQSNTGTDFLETVPFLSLYESGKYRPYRNPKSGPSSP
jgi:hypothetical protein